MTIPFSITGGSRHVAFGSKTFTATGGTVTWNVPVGVNAVSIICVGAGGGNPTGGGGGGGGALAYVNDVAVTPGEALTILVGVGSATSAGGTSNVRNSAGTTLVSAGGGGLAGSTAAGTGGVVVTGTGFSGGAGGGVASNRGGGGGGAGGYTAAGGAGGAGNAAGVSSTGGGGGGGGGGTGANASGGTGGGVGVSIGAGLSGVGGITDGNGTNGSVPTGDVGYGGGGGGSLGTGGNGIVKIVWRDPTVGSARTFPSTRVVDDDDFTIYPYYSTSTATSTIVLPSPVQDGDIAILFDVSTTATTTIPTAVIPTGFTPVSNVSISSTSSGRSIISYKVLTSAEGGTTLTGMANPWSKILIVARPNQPLISTNTLTIANSVPSEQATTSSTPTTQTIAMTSANPTKKTVLFYFASYASPGSLSTTRGLAGVPWTAITSTQTLHVVRYGDYRASETPANGSVSLSTTLENFNILQSAYLILDIA